MILNPDENTIATISKPTTTNYTHIYLLYILFREQHKTIHTT